MSAKRLRKACSEFVAMFLAARCNFSKVRNGAKREAGISIAQAWPTLALPCLSWYLGDKERPDTLPAHAKTSAATRISPTARKLESSSRRRLCPGRLAAFVVMLLLLGSAGCQTGRGPMSLQAPTMRKNPEPPPWFGPETGLITPPGTDWPDDPLAQMPETGWPEVPLESEDPFEWEAMPLDMVDEEIKGRVPPGTLKPSTEALAMNIPPASTLPNQPGLLPPVESSAPASSADPPIAHRMAAAWRHFYDGNLDRSLVAFLDLTQQAPHRSDAFLGAGQVQLALGNASSALDLFIQAREITPTNVEAGFFIGLALYQQEDFAAAIQWWLHLQPQVETLPSSELYRNFAWLLARSYLELYDRTEGERWFKTALLHGGQDEWGALRPPPESYEWLVSGRIPGGHYQPVGARSSTTFAGAVLFSGEGVIWSLPGASMLAEQLTFPEEGFRDSHPNFEAQMGRLAFVRTGNRLQPDVLVQEQDGKIRTIATNALAIRPSFSPPGTELAFVTLRGDNPTPKVQWTHLNSGDREAVAWPDGPSTDPTFLPDRSLLMSCQPNTRFRICRFIPGDSKGEILPTLPNEKQESVSTPSRPALPTLAKADKSLTETRSRRGGPRRLLEPWESRTLEPLKKELSAQVDSESREKALEPSPTVASAELPAARPRSEEPLLLPDGAISAPPDLQTLRNNAAEQLQARRDGTLASTKAPTPPQHLPIAGSTPLEPPRFDDQRSPSAILLDGVPVIAFTRQFQDQRQIWVRDPRVGTERQVSPPTLDCASPSFDSSGQRLFFSCLEPDRRALFLHLLIEKRTERVFSSSLEVKDPVWIPNAEPLTSETVAESPSLR